MKKILLSILAITTVAIAQAQNPFILSGTSYTQDFNSIGNGIPQGWRFDSLVNKNAGLGNDASFRFSASIVSWGGSTSRGFKNVASAAGLTATSTTTDQSASSNRALGIRQVSASGWDKKDSLTSASFEVANTTGLTGFNLNFKIMSLSTAAKRYNNWIVQYGIGVTPAAFTTVATTPATLIIDSNFSSTNVSVNFGTALDNQSQPVWIRIMPSDTTMGSGTRPLVGIDDYNLTWTGTAVNNIPQIVSLSPLDNAAGVAAGTTNLSITFDKTITIGTGNVTVYNLTDATSQVIAATSTSASGVVVTIPGVNLVAGKNYAVQYDSTCYKWTTYNGQGIYNNTAWNFSTASGVVTSLNESFIGCNFPILGSFSQYSVVGSAQNWRCSNFGHNDSDAVYVNGYAAGVSNDNEDWLISPPLNMSAMTSPYLGFWSKYRFAGNTTKEVFVSNNYTGAGDPTIATWTPLSVNFATLDTVYTAFSNYNLTAYKATPFYIAFKYVSSATGSADEWSVDDVHITDGPESVTSYIANSLELQVYGSVNDGHFAVGYTSKKSEMYSLIMTDLVGNAIYKKQVQILAGSNKIDMNLPTLANGMYILSLQNATERGTVKIIKQ